MDWMRSAWNWVWPSYGYDSSKLKMLLKAGSIRLSLHKRKCEESVSNLKIELLDLIKQDNKDELCRIKAENILTNERKASVYEILLVVCENIASKLALLDASEAVPEELNEAISTLLYAAPRIDVEELRQASQQLVLKYGNELENETTDGEESHETQVNPKVVEGLSVEVPEEKVVSKFLEDYYGHNRALLKDEAPPGSPSKKPRRGPSKSNINDTAAEFAPLDESAAPPPLNPDYVEENSGAKSNSKQSKRKFDSESDNSDEEKKTEDAKGDDWDSLNDRLNALKDASKK